MRVLIDNGQGYVDYTRYVVDGSLSIEDSVNVPTTTNFVLAASDNSFVVPKRSAYVRIESEIYLGSPGATGGDPRLWGNGGVEAWFFENYQGNDGVFAWPSPTSTGQAQAHATGNSLVFESYILHPPVNWHILDVNGNDIGAFQPWSGATTHYNMAVAGTLHFPAAGTYTLQIDHDDGMFFAISGATFLSGLTNDPFNHFQTAVMGYRFVNGGVAGHNVGGGATHEQYTFSVPAAGPYGIEIDWAQAIQQSYLTVLNQGGSGGNHGNVPPTVEPSILATGFITSEPERTYLGLNHALPSFGFQQLAYSIKVSSDEWLLNTNAVPYIPAFINQTAGQILSSIAEAIAPGFLNVFGFVGPGDLIPFYQYSSDQTWSDIAKFFGDSLRYRYKVINRVLYFLPFEQVPLGVAYDETSGEKNFFPLELTTNIVSVPPVNDCIVFGGTEPQANWENHFIGDGVTSQFRLLHNVFQGSTALLLEDDWTEAAIQSNLWLAYEHEAPIFGNGTIFSLFDQVTGQTAGSLLVESGADVSIDGDTYIVGVNGVELGGGLNLQHGEFTFTDTCYGIVGGVYYTQEIIESNCWAGFQLTTSGATLGQLLSVTHPSQVTASGAGGIIIQPLYLGAPVGPQVVSQPNHTYLLQTWIGASQWNRYENVYRNLTGDVAYGGNYLTASGTVTWVITDNNLGAYAALPVGTTPVQADQLVKPVVTKYTLQEQNPPQFVAYSPVDVFQCNFSLQNTIIANPPEGSLYVVALTGASGLQLPVLPANLGVEQHYLMGFGQQNQTATVLAQSDSQFLAFYDDSIPGVGSRIRYQSWAAGQSSARVTDPIAIANEAAISGDNGIRSAIMQNLQPTPRTSNECSFAAAAAIHDREYPQWQGTYTVETVPNKFINLMNPGVYDYPRSGELLYINSPYRAISGEFFVANTVRIQVTELREEVLQIAVDYGPDLYLERTLSNFVQRLDLTTQVLTPQETAPPPDLIHIDQVGNAFLQDLRDAKITAITNSPLGNTISIDLGVVPVTGVEVRRADFNWGNQGITVVGGTQRYSDPNLISVLTPNPTISAQSKLTGTTFNLTRSSRDQTWYLRQVNGALHSQFSKALRVVYPFIPSPPLFQSLTSNNLVLGLNGFVDDIYGVELRLPGLSGTYILNYDQGQPTNVGPIQIINYMLRISLADNTTPYNTLVDIIQNPNQSFAFQVGDIVKVSSTVNNSFNGLKVLNGVVPQFGLVPSLGPNVHGNYVDAFFYYQLGGNPGVFKPDGSGVKGHVLGNSLEFNPPEMGSGLDPNVQPIRWGLIGSNAQLISYSQPFVAANNSWSVALVFGFFIPAAGTYSFTCNHDDGMAIGIGNSGANTPTYVSGPTTNLAAAPLNGNSYVQGYPLLAGYNANFSPRGQLNDTFSFHFPAAGVYPAEIDFYNWENEQMMSFRNGDGSLLAPGYLERLEWFDFGQPFPVQAGVDSLASTNVGQVNLQARGLNASVSSGSVTAGIVTIHTSTAHGFNPGDVVVLGCRTTPLGTSHDASPFCGLWVLLSASGTTFTFKGGPSVPVTLPSTNLIGRVAQFLAAGVNTTVNVSGALIDRPVFSPSDLSFDLTDPTIQDTLEIAQLLNPSGFQINAYFFNLMWDYSDPLPLLNVVVPTISGISVDPASMQVKWAVIGGRPSGYRVQVVDVVSGQTYNKYTIDHPHNLQSIVSFQMTPEDFFNTRQITLTPFNALGDGPGLSFLNVSLSGYTGLNNNQFYQILNFNQTIPPPPAGYQNVIPQNDGGTPVENITAYVPNFVGDFGAGGLNGAVPMPPAGSSASGYYLFASGGWAPITNQPYDVTFGVAGKPPANTILPIETFPRLVTFPGNFAGSQGSDGTNPTSTATYTIKKNNATTVGTISVSTGGVFTFTSTGGTQVQFTVGDRLTVITPNPQDATLSDVTVTLAGIRR